MKALTRMRKLAAVISLLALTLSLCAPLAQANIPGRPVDRPEGPPDPNPTSVGDPEQSSGGLPVPIVIGDQVILLRLPAVLAKLIMARYGTVAPSSAFSARNWRVRNAR